MFIFPGQGITRHTLPTSPSGQWLLVLIFRRYFACFYPAVVRSSHCACGYCSQRQRRRIYPGVSSLTHMYLKILYDGLMVVKKD